MGGKLDPLIDSAVRWLDVLRARRSGSAAQAEAPPPALGNLAESVADRLQAEELPRYAWLDVGIWGRPVFRSAAEIALRLKAVSVSGDEAG
jgi:hypothetical protein